MKMNCWKAEESETGDWTFTHVQPLGDFYDVELLEGCLIGRPDKSIEYYYKKDKVEEKDRFKSEFKTKIREQLKNNIKNLEEDINLQQKRLLRLEHSD